MDEHKGEHKGDSKKRARDEEDQPDADLEGERAAKRQKTDADLSELVKKLIESGVICIPMKWANIPELMKEFKATLAEMPEFNKDLPAKWSFPTKFDPEHPDAAEEKTIAMQWTGGGFGALGNPSSQHNPFVRRLRQWVMATLVPLFSLYIDTHLVPGGNEESKDDDEDQRPWRLEKTFDRMLVRSVDQKPTAESLHRDECPRAKADDVVFGGWFNCTDKTQTFTCVPKSHRGAADGKTTGFSKIDKKKNPAEFKDLMSRLTQEKVRPGELILFCENIAHIVAPNPTKETMFRTFMGWRLTRSEQPLVRDVIRRIEQQAVVPLKSDQVPPMWPQQWRATEIARLQAWSKIVFDERLLVTEELKSGNFKGHEITIVPRYLESLRYYQRKFPDKQWMQPEYTADEKEMYVPGTEWNLLVPGSKTEYERVHL